MVILGIDPGEKESGVVLFGTDSRSVLHSRHMDNVGLAVWLSNALRKWHREDGGHWLVNCVVCEKPVAMGQPLSSNLVETIHWCGAFWWAWPDQTSWHWVTRNQVKVAICGKCQGVKDSHVLTGTQELFGGRDVARGNKKSPGPCYGVSGHCWQALAAVMAWLKIKE
jgi:hypothetical protein